MASIDIFYCFLDSIQCLLIRDNGIYETLKLIIPMRLQSLTSFNDMCFDIDKLTKMKVIGNKTRKRSETEIKFTSKNNILFFNMKDFNHMMWSIG